MQTAPSQTILGESEQFPPQHLSSDEPKVIDASHILKYPHRTTRPDHIVVILRGLPGIFFFSPIFYVNFHHLIHGSMPLSLKSINVSRVEVEHVQS